MSKSGETFGMWSLVCQVESHDRHIRWRVRCRCGAERVRTLDVVRKNKVGGCGCSRRKRPFESLYNRLLNFSLRRNLAVGITYDDFLQFTTKTACHYCGDEIVWNEFRSKTRSAAYNLDRKDNRIGYSKSNCVVCCSRCNKAKSNFFTYEQWVEISAVIRSWK